MAVVTDYILIDILLAILSLTWLICWYFTNNNDYWTNRGVPNIRKRYLLHFMLGKLSQAEANLELYNFYPEEKFFGFFQIKKPVLLVRDPYLIHQILVKDFIHFQDRGNPVFKNDDLMDNLFNLRGNIWRALRYKLTPTFTTGKIKSMFEQVSRSGDNMMRKIDELIKKNNEFETKPFVFEFTLEVITSCAFGLQIEPNSSEFNMFKTAFRQLFTGSISTMFRFITLMACPKLAAILNLKTFPNYIVDYFFNLTSANMKYRKDNNIQRNDYFQLLMTLKDQEESGKEMLVTSDKTEDDEVIDQMRFAEVSEDIKPVNIKLITEKSICANSFIFLSGGSESTASTISFALLSLAQNLDIQYRLQEEVDSVLKQRGSWTYDAIKDMTYLDQVLQESMRIYPLLPSLLRECVIPYKIPGSDLVLEKGVLINIPLMGLHKDPQYYPEPDSFNPDRFQGNNFKPNPTYLPFGDGPRICIAMRFAVMEVKTCLAKIMSQYTVKLSPKTKLPIRFDKRAFLPAVDGGIWLCFHKRNST